MWKREVALRPIGVASGKSREGDSPSGPMREPHQTAESSRSIEKDFGNIGKFVVIKGEVNGSQDLNIDGRVEGKIEVRQHVLTVGLNGKIKAQVFAKSVVVLGEVIGNITATETVNIMEKASVDGDVSAPRVAIAEGAHFRGSIEMQRSSAKKSTAENKAALAPTQADEATIR